MEVDVVSCETRVWIVWGGLGYLLIRVMDNPDAGHARIENIMGFIRGVSYGLWYSPRIGTDISLIWV